jgi:hypothetical protein
MDTGMAGAITAVAATTTVGAEGAATIMVGGTIIIDRDLTLKRPPRLAASIMSARYVGSVPFLAGHPIPNTGL